VSRVRGRVALALLAPFLAVACGGDGGTPDGDGPASSSAVDRATNVLLVVCDTLRADRLGPYGGELNTPATDRLAARGVTWEDNRAQGCWTLPSMLSMMTGRYIGVKSRALPANQPSMADLMSEAGFACGAFVANGVAGPERDFDRSFDEYQLFVPETEADRVAGEFLAWRDSLADPQQRWFGWVHFMDPHSPYGPTLEPGARLPAAEPGLREAWDRSEDFIRQRVPDYDEQPVVKGRAFMLLVRAEYDIEVERFDRGLGRLLDGLEERGELDSTLVVLASDHGEALYENPLYPGLLAQRFGEERGVQLASLQAEGHDYWYFPETWNTPLIMSGPGLARGVVGRGMSANIDILPTILAATGVDGPDDLDGLDLVGRTSVEREHVFAYGRDTTAAIDTAGNFWVEMPRKLSGIARDELRSGLLYSLEKGRFGLRGRRGDDSSIASALVERIEEWRGGLTLEPNQQVDEGADRILIELGYVEGED